MPMRIAFLRCSDGQAGRGKADDDGVVAGKHEIDGDDLEQGRQACGGENFHRPEALCLFAACSSSDMPTP